jgi:pescadillo protein
MDRPLADPESTREYILPQWIYDSVNHQICLPPSQYPPDKEAPPHLSPFVNNKQEGYIPTRQKEINEMKGITEEVYVPDIDSEENQEEAPILAPEIGKFDDESSDSEDDEAATKKDK